MARMHSRKRGKSGSIRPVGRRAPAWMTRSAKEIEHLIVKLAKEGKSAPEIGILLRDNYGVPSVKIVAGKSISDLLKEHNLMPKLPFDMTSLIGKAILLRKHLEENRQDMAALRGLQLTESKIKRLMKYYKKTGKLPQDWKYDPKTASLLVQ